LARPFSRPTRRAGLFRATDTPRSRTNARPPACARRLGPIIGVSDAHR
jgi:hypothetical protein